MPLLPFADATPLRFRFRCAAAFFYMPLPRFDVTVILFCVTPRYYAAVFDAFLSMLDYFIIIAAPLATPPLSPCFDA